MLGIRSQGAIERFTELDRHLVHHRCLEGIEQGRVEGIQLKLCCVSVGFPSCKHGVSFPDQALRQFVTSSFQDQEDIVPVFGQSQVKITICFIEETPVLQRPGFSGGVAERRLHRMFCMYLVQRI